MRKIFLIGLLAATSICAKAQISAGSLQLQNYGTHYRISVNQMPYNNKYPKPDSVSLRVTVICKKTGAYQVNFLPITGHLNYRLGGDHIISAAAIWWKNGVKKGQSSMQTLCGFYTNPLECYEKI